MDFDSKAISDKRRGYLLCPQCGDRRFYCVTAGGEKAYLKISHAGEFLVGIDECVQVTTDHESTGVYCCGCSWSGGVRKLVKIFCG